MAYVHNISPFALKITDNFGIRWYGLSYLVGFLLAYLVIRNLSKTDRSPLALLKVGDFIFAAALGCIIGGRLGYCFFYEPALLVDFRFRLPFWGALALNEGGMASHGGIMGIIIACVIYGKRHHLPIWHLIDLCAYTGPLGVFFGRLANFINGELVGRPCDPNLAWAVKFPQDILLWPRYLPDRLKELEGALSLIGVSSESWHKLLGAFPIGIQKIDQILYSVIERVQNGDQALRVAIGEVLTPRHPSQIYEALLEGLVLFLLLFFVWRSPRKTGVLTGYFLIFYSILRVVGEQFRMPDAHIGFQIFQLTRGQILSLIMLLIGLIILIYRSTTSNSRLYSGLFGRQP
ncbi:MAG TPA: prolipoprotein diacylglyceryl transferase [Oligoflexia bacterium]|nr:prolipoprotein diacylglyceryl transferase [Oligoflexia bacterium]HMP26629.1 prolipoprotein diacylglyceryl transferase [Oligoflexia bacterium]